MAAMRNAPKLVAVGTLLLSVLCMCFPVLGDEWPAPQVREVFSPNRNHFVRITPGASWGDSFGFGSSPRGPYARAQFHHRKDDSSYVPDTEMTLLNPVAPVESFVNDKGFLATVDNWHNTGYGKILALYSPSGAIVASYTLSDLFSDEEAEKFTHSVSSILWHTGSLYLQP